LFLNDFLYRRFSESVPYQDETLTYLPDRYFEHRPILVLGLDHALRSSVL
jgi:hypothetical protein